MGSADENVSPQHGSDLQCDAIGRGADPPADEKMSPQRGDLQCDAIGRGADPPVSPQRGDLQLAPSVATDKSGSLTEIETERSEEGEAIAKRY